MTMLDPLSVAFIAATFLLAGFVKGVIGLGLPTVAVGLLSLSMTPAEAAALLVVPSLATNLWQAAAGPRLPLLLRRFWPLFVGICPGTLAGSALLTADKAGHATTALGLVLVLYAALGFRSLQLRLAAVAEIWLSPLVGAATGLVTAATGVFVLPAVPYLQALALEKEELVQALGLSFTASTLALAAGLAWQGLFEASLAGASLMALLPALAGMALGQTIRGRVRPAAFRRCFLFGLLALGGHLALQGLL